MTVPSPRIHVLLPVHNRRATTEKFIRCLLAQTHRNWRLILIDDGSRDGTAEMARALVPEATILSGAGKWWWAGALQQGLDRLISDRVPAEDLVLIINDDTEFGPDFLANAAAAVRPNSLLLARAYRLATGEFSEVGVYWDWRKLICTPVKDGGEVNCFSTRGLFLTFGDFVRIGGFHTRMLPHYLSDYEFTLRAHRKGFALISDERVVLHYDEALTGLRDIEDRSMWQRMLADFSIRSAGNPVYWTSFVLLASPLRYVPLNIVRVWAGFFTPVRVRIRAALIVPGRIFLGKVKRKTIKLWTTGQW